MASPGAAPELRRFHYRAARIGLSCVAGLLLLLCLVAFGSSSPWWAGFAYLPFAIFFGFRAFMGSTVVIHESIVELRGYWRTSRVPLDMVGSAEVELGRNNLDRPWEYLVLQRRDGTTAAFKELGARPFNTKPTWIRAAAQAINASLL